MISSLPLMAIAPVFAGREGAALAPALPPRKFSHNHVAVVEIVGVLYKSELVSLREKISRLAADDRIGELVLLVDSPGGTVAGTHDLYAAITRAAGRKRVTAVVEDLCASAAYYAIAGASEIVVNPTGQVGSIGAYVVLLDQSRLFDKLGIDVWVISSGPQKGRGVPGSKISAEQIAQVQAVVDETARHFMAAVARGRKLSAAKVNELADGRILVGNQARAAGLVDRIASLEDVLAEAERRAEPLSYRHLTGAAALAKYDELVAAAPWKDGVRIDHPELAAEAAKHREELAHALKVSNKFSHHRGI